MITFSTDATWERDEASVVFEADADGEQIRCVMPLETLGDRFPMATHNPMFTFQANRRLIETVTRAVIDERNRPSGPVVIRGIDFLGRM
jgi:hypothetical protein